MKVYFYVRIGKQYYSEKTPSRKTSYTYQAKTWEDREEAVTFATELWSKRSLKGNRTPLSVSSSDTGFVSVIVG